MKKVVVIRGSYGFDSGIDVPDSTDFKVGDSIYYDYIHTKITEVQHNLEKMITYFICG